MKSAQWLMLGNIGFLIALNPLFLCTSLYRSNIRKQLNLRIQEVFKPLPPEEVEALREYMD